MSRREKILLFAVIGLVALFVADRLVIAPLSSAFGAVAEETAALETQLSDARNLINRRTRIEDRWHSYQAAGLDSDMGAARALVQRRLAEWSKSAGLSLETLSTGRVIAGERFEKITFIVSGTGSLASVQQFLWHVRMAEFPLRIEQCDLANRKETEDSLMFSLNLSTIVSAPQQQAGGAS